MPLKEQHLDRVRYNLNHLSFLSLRCPDSNDWQVTAAFYAALHLVHADLVQHKMVVRTHKEMTETISNLAGMQPVKLPYDRYNDYSLLLKDSYKARYLADILPHVKTRRSYVHPKTVLQNLRRLDRLLQYYQNKFGITFELVPFSAPFSIALQTAEFKVLKPLKHQIEIAEDSA